MKIMFAFGCKYVQINVDGMDENDSIGPVTTTIIEWCPRCKSQRGCIEVEDAPHEDCNFFQAMKEYKVVQQSGAPNKCDCDTVLVPLVL